MPIYEYQCQSCGHTLDALQKISEPPLSDCPDCGEAALRKLISAPMFRLKGSGWYETDFKSDNRRNLADAPGAEEKPAKKDADGKEAKPAAAAADTAKSSGDTGKSDAGKAKSSKSTPASPTTPDQ